MLRSSLLTILLAFSAAASAEGFDYNYFSLGYGTIEFDDINVDGDGFGIDGSFAINDNFHAFAAYNAAGLDFGVDATTLGAGIGYNHGLAPNVDLVARLSYEYIELDVPSFGSVDDNGLGLGLGLRVAASENLELNGGIQHVDLSDSGSDTGFEAGGLYSFTDAFSLGLGGSWSDDSSAYTVSGRFYFGR